MKQKLMACILSLLLPLTFLSSCAKNNGTDSSGRTVIRYTNWEVLPTQIELMRQIIAKFEKQNPDIKVKLEWGSKSDKIITELAGNSAADVFYWVNPVDLFNKDVLEDLTPYIEKYKVNLKNYYPTTVLEGSHKGRLMMFPLHFSSYCLAYNKDIFDKAGLPYPTDKWTWDDFYKTAKSLTRDNNGDGGRDWYGTTLPQKVIMLRMNGGTLINEKTLEPAIDTKETREFIDFDVKLYKECCPSPEEEETFGGKVGVNLFMTGKIATQIAPTFMLAQFSKISAFKWDVTAIPVPTGKQRKNFITTGGLCIPKQCKNKDAAFRFIQFYCGPEGQALLAQTKNCVPSLIEAAKTSFAVPPPDNIKYYLTAAENASMLQPQISAYKEIISQHFNKELQLVELGKKTPEQAIKDIVAGSRVILDTYKK
ncbi:MAG: sugar ABC transporter substrate-binding protein [Elusimicrobiota bacterium]